MMKAIIDELEADPHGVRRRAPHADRRRRGRDPHRGADRRRGHGRHAHAPRLHQADADTRVRGAGSRRPRHHRRHARPTATSSPTCSPRRRTTTCSCSPTRAASTTRRCSSCREGARTAKGRAVVNVLELQDGEQVVAMLPFKRVRRRHVGVLRDAVRHRQEDASFASSRTCARAASRRSRSRTATASSAPRSTTPAHDVLLTQREGLRGALHRGSRAPDGPHRGRRARHLAARRRSPRRHGARSRGDARLRRR